MKIGMERARDSLSRVKFVCFQVKTQNAVALMVILQLLWEFVF